ncbi:MAG: PadR family transcriptional regulator [Candidatus Altiarchaeota archaeon]|nr:PadR family transcriptional regulator [Candidatus Altiarchaeota archaeon]
MNPNEFERELHWIDNKLVKGMGKIHYLCIINRGVSTGYDIIKYIKKNFHINLSTAAVYPLLQSLETEGYLTAVWKKEGYPNKKSYSITPKGKKLLTAAKKRIHAIIYEEITKR